MPFGLSLKKLIRSNPNASLRERAAELRSALPSPSRRTIMAASVAAAVPLPSFAAAHTQEPTEYADYRDRLLAAYAEDRACRSIDGEARVGSLEDVACTLVVRRCWAIADEIGALPPPRTLDGLAVVALAATILWEVSHPDTMSERAAVALIRSILAMTGTELPPRFSGFGDEPDAAERDAVLYTAPGTLPAWAIAEAKADYDFDDA